MKMWKEWQEFKRFRNQQPDRGSGYVWQGNFIQMIWQTFRSAIKRG